MRPIYEIDTPENVRFSFERAGLSSRAFAWFLDVLVMMALLTAASTALAPFQLLLGKASGALGFVVAFLVQWWYAALCEWRFAGCTVGKRIVGLATMDDRGLKLSLYQAVIRNLLRIVDFLPGLYLVGGLASLADPHGRRLGDLAAGTVVVRERRAQLPRRTLAEAQRDAHRYPALAEAGRRLTPQERDAVLALCTERDRLPLAMRSELFTRLAGHLEARLGLSRPAHLSAEKVVLYMAAALAGTVSSPMGSRLGRKPQES
jgi:uncharacterized RDD family membrane protein YckC